MLIGETGDGGGIYGNSALSTQFFCKPKTATKKKNIHLKKIT